MKDPIKVIHRYKNKNRRNQFLVYIFVGNLVPDEIKKILNKINITGIEISKYAIKNSHPSVKPFIINADAKKKLKFKNKQFDLAFSLATLHNFNLSEIEIALSEMSRVSKKQYMMVESYRDDREMFNLQCWALTAKTLVGINDWRWIFNKVKYKGDYEFIFFK